MNQLLVAKKEGLRQPTFTLHAGDVELLRRFVEFTYLRPFHLGRLSGRNLASIRRRLRQLHVQGYLQRFRLPMALESLPANPRVEPTQWVYALNHKGVAAVQDVGLADENLRANPEKSEHQLPHDLLITSFHLAIELALRAHPSFKIHFWEQRRAVLQHRFLHQGRESVITPDAFFIMADERQDNNARHFFLEVQRSRPSEYENGTSNLIRKAKAFVAYRQANPDGPPFRVLFVFPTLERSLNFCAAAQKAGLGLKRIWTTHTAAFSIEQADTVLAAIWRSAKDYQSGALYSILE